MRTSRREFLALSSLAAATAMTRASLAAGTLESRKTRNVVLITFDGLRPEEVFNGAEEALLNKEAGGVADPDGLRRRFWRETPEERRETLLPFLWKTVGRHGQFLGNQAKGSTVRITNGKYFSYPGYNELLTGAPDDRIDSNDKKPNPNVNVLEWLDGKPEFTGRVSAYGSWDVFPYILNRERSGLSVNAGWEPIRGESLTHGQKSLNHIMEDLPHVWSAARFDALTFASALEEVRSRKPRVLYIAFGETDEFAHEGRYDHYLDAANRTDAMIGRLWKTLQADPHYQGTTSMVLATDHGRGGVPDGWKHHGANVPGAEHIWIAAIGPDTPALGERTNVPESTQSQVAATVAALLGEDYAGAFPDRVAPPIAEIVGKSAS